MTAHRPGGPPRPLAVNGCQVHVLDEGAGPPVVFLHGNPDSSAVWVGVVDALRPRFRCFTPDLPGFGLSTAPADFDYTLDGLVGFVESLVGSALGTSGPVDVVGHDFGGIIAAAWASKFPQRIRRLALANTSFSGDYRWHFWAHVWRTPLIGEFSALTMNKPLFARELRRGSPRLTMPYIEATYRSITPATKRAVLKLYRSVRRHSVSGWEELFRQAATQIPVLVLWGDGDPYIPGEFADRLHARKIVHFADAGHWVQVVEPLRFAEELAAFFGASGAGCSASGAQARTIGSPVSPET